MATESEISQLKVSLVDRMKRECKLTESKREEWKEHLIGLLPEEEKSKFLVEISEKRKVGGNSKTEDDEHSFASIKIPLSMEDVFVAASERLIRSLASSATLSLAAIVGVTIGVVTVAGIAVARNGNVSLRVGSVALDIQGGPNQSPNQDQQIPPGSDRSLRD